MKCRKQCVLLFAVGLVAGRATCVRNMRITSSKDKTWSCNVAFFPDIAYSIIAGRYKGA